MLMQRLRGAWASQQTGVDILHTLGTGHMYSPSRTSAHLAEYLERAQLNGVRGLIVLRQVCGHSKDRVAKLRFAYN